MTAMSLRPLHDGLPLGKQGALPTEAARRCVMKAIG